MPSQGERRRERTARCVPPLTADIPAAGGGAGAEDIVDLSPSNRPRCCWRTLAPHMSRRRIPVLGRIASNREKKPPIIVIHWKHKLDSMTEENHPKYSFYIVRI